LTDGLKASAKGGWIEIVNMTLLAIFHKIISLKWPSGVDFSLLSARALRVSFPF
jgi:hypothetical protein